MLASEKRYYEQKIRDYEKRLRAIEAQNKNNFVQTSDGIPFFLGKITGSEQVEGKTVFDLAHSTVDEQRDEVFKQCHALGSTPATDDFAVMAIDRAGNRYLLPSPSGLVCVEDIGEGQAKEVVIDENGNVTTPASSETLDYAVAESIAFFHGSTNTTKEGRRYPAVKLQKFFSPGNFYLVYIEGHGDEVTTLEDTITVNDGDNIKVELGVDGQGNGKRLNLSKVV